jgi:hypothetical protein
VVLVRDAMVLDPTCCSAVSVASARRVVDGGHLCSISVLLYIFKRRRLCCELEYRDELILKPQSFVDGQIGQRIAHVVVGHQRLSKANA